MFSISSLIDSDTDRVQDSIKIRLECVSATLKHPVRHLTLHAGRPITIGRASKNTSKNLQPAPNNAFFDCPVMSRNHAELTYEHGDLVSPTYLTCNRTHVHSTNTSTATC